MSRPAPDPRRDGRTVRPGPHRPIALLALLALAVLASSCAYYNTFYLARKYYFKGTAGLPYLVDKRDAAATQNFTKAIDYSKKVMGSYAKSKWVDDAYLLWARALLGRDDPRETVNMLQDFPVRFPRSDLRPEALFYLGVGYRQSRRYGEAETTLEQYLEQAPRTALSPYAWLERARALSALDRDSAAAHCASQVLERFPKSRLVAQAQAARGQARLDIGDHARAREDFQALGKAAIDDEERLLFLFREADCLEAARGFDEELALFREALSHERPPVVTEGTSGPVAYVPTPGGDRYGRILIRIGTVHLLAERQKEALEAYQEVIRLYPKSPLSAEARYRIGYAYETSGDDFEQARGEYVRVKEEFANSAFSAQAESRQTNLDRLKQFRTAGGDTLQKRAESGFMLAELYLFQLGKPERALEEYRKVSTELEGTAWAAKALTAEAWVLGRKLNRKAEADSLFWVVVRRYPATESQLAARDYLEQDGATVPDSLIRLPVPVAPAPVDTTPLTPPPAGTPQLSRSGLADSAGVVTGGPAGPGGLGGPGLRLAGPGGRLTVPPDTARAVLADTTRRVPADTTRRVPADSLRRVPADSLRRVPADTTRRVPADTTRRAPADTTRRAAQD